MDKANKEICVFIPCYNRERYIEETVNSLFDQTLQEFDVVIVDDGSEDNTYSIIERLADKDSRIRVYQNQKNMGLGITRNLMFEYCKGYKYVALMDSDDLSPANRLELEYNYLENNEDVTCVAGLTQYIDQNGELGRIVDEGFRSYEEIKRIMVFRNIIANSTPMMRMEDLLTNDIRYRTHFFCIQDYMFFCELIQKCKMVILPYILQYYRQHAGNISKTSLKRSKERDKLMDEIHEYTFKNFGVRMNFFERYIFKRGFRDTNSNGFIFQKIFFVTKYFYRHKHPEYKGLI